MDNNKIVDNLNFIKIYFRIFIYKIIVLKKPELSRNEIKKNHGRRMKTCLDTRTGSKNPRKRVQMVPEHENGFDIQKNHWALLGFGPTAFG